MPRNALGRGIEALIRPQQKPAPPSAPPETSSLGGEQPLLIPVEAIDPSPFQPRTRFSEQALEELAGSIRSSGILQPVIVRRIGSRYQLVAGERRWRAAMRAGLQQIPALVREFTDEMALQVALIENLQREDLNPIEEARVYAQLVEQFGLTQEEVAQRTGRERATVANALRLLRLEPEIRTLIEQGKLTAGHGRALLAVEDPTQRKWLAARAAQGTLTVRQIERLARRRPRKAAAQASLDPNVRAALEELQRCLGTRVRLRPASPRRPGLLLIEFYTDEQLMSLYDRLTGTR